MPHIRSKNWEEQVKIKAVKLSVKDDILTVQERRALIGNKKKIILDGPMSSIYSNMNIYFYLLGYTCATDPRCEGNHIGAGKGVMGTGPRHG